MTHHRSAATPTPARSGGRKVGDAPECVGVVLMVVS